MANLTPDQTFYATPMQAMQAPHERLAYVLDDRFLYVSCWGTGELRQYDPRFFTDFGPMRPHQVRLEGGDSSSDSFCYPD